MRHVQRSIHAIEIDSGTACDRPQAQWQTASGGKLPPWDRRRSHPTKWRFRQWALFELTSSDIGLERVKDSAVSRPYGVPSGLPRRNLPELLLSLATQLSARITTVLINNKESSVVSLFCFKEQSLASKNDAGISDTLIAIQ